MKINIDESTFNEAVSKGKLELCDWLFEKGCPNNSYCYISANDIKTLDWLYSKNIAFDKRCLADVINVCENENIINWFINKGAIVDSNVINSCIKRGRKNLFDAFITRHNISFSVDNFKAAVFCENREILDVLKKNKCPYDDSVAESAMKHKKKFSIRWLVMNDYI
jgi:hypothetical protein